jgi:hypothetical protein
MTQTIVLSDAHRKRTAIDIIAQAPLGHVAKISAPVRSLEQNNRLWAMLSDLARAKPEGREYPSEHWKALTMDMAGHKPIWHPALDGDGIVCVGYKSSRLTVAEMCDVQTAIEAYAAQHEVELGR